MNTNPIVNIIWLSLFMYIYPYGTPSLTKTCPLPQNDTTILNPVSSVTMDNHIYKKRSGLLYHIFNSYISRVVQKCNLMGKQLYAQKRPKVKRQKHTCEPTTTNV